MTQRHPAQRFELTDIEREVAIALGRGQRPPQIAQARKVSIGTIRGAIERACNRLALSGWAALGEHARNQGWAS